MTLGRYIKIRWIIYFLIFSIWILWLIQQRVASFDNFIVEDCVATIKGQRSAVLVLGAKVDSSNNISPVFADRLDTAVSLYEAGLVKKILVSGDHGTVFYDEVNAGKEYLLAQDVLAEDIFLDHAGFDTFDSIYRAKNVFNLDSLLISTQDFHLSRSLYIAQRLDMDAWGCRADKRYYSNIDYMKRREWLASIKAWLDINLGSRPKFLGVVIDINGDGHQTWD